MKLLIIQYTMKYYMILIKSLRDFIFLDKIKISI